MKYSTTLFVLISSFLVFALALTKPSIAADLQADANEPVLDIHGEELRAGTSYYILSVFRPGGGLTIARTRGQACPFDVVQDFLGNGWPLIFTPVNPEEDVIRVSTDLNIKFAFGPLICRSTVWQIQNSSNSEIQWSVTTDGVEGNPGCDTVYNWFKIEKSGILENSYKLVFCPSVCDDIVPCGDLGLYINNNGDRILSLADKPGGYDVVFRKVSGHPLSSVV